MGDGLAFVDVPGDFPTLVLIHSSGLSSTQWRALMELGLGHVIAVDLPGYGKSDPPPQGPVLQSDAAAIEAFVRGRGEEVVLVGHSYGGFLAFAVARRLPNLRGIIVHEPVLWGALASMDPVLARQSMAAIDHDGLFFSEEDGGGDAWFERFVDFWSGDGAWRALSDRQRARFVAVGRKVYREVSELCRDPTPHTAYAAISTPTLVTVGEESPELERRVCRVVTDAMPNAQLSSIAGGHMAPVTHPAGFAAEVRHFLRQIDGP